MCETAERIADQRGIDVTWNMETKIPPLPIKEEMQQKLARIISEMGLKPVYIPSGAGHDTMILGQEIPVAMIFARSKDGISHNPKEWTSLNDCVVAVHVLKNFVEEATGEMINQ